MTAAKNLSHNTLNSIVDYFKLEEVTQVDGGHFKVLTSQFGPVGSIRIFKGEAIKKLVYISMTVDAFGLDSHMIFAFTPEDSAIPHFTLDSVATGDEFAFHLDMLPRVDLGANLDYITGVFSPLDEVYAEASKIEGLTPARLLPTQYAIMSPWMLVFRATAEAFDAIQAPVNQYLEHWYSVVENGVPDVPYSPAELTARDEKNRAAIFNPEVDKVWAQVERLLGADMGEYMRGILKNPEVESVG